MPEMISTATGPSGFRKFLLSSVHLLVAVQNSIVKNSSILGYSQVLGNPRLVRLGTDYGGWWIPESFLLQDNKKRTVLSIGIGHDVSFDKELLKRGFQCIALDPIIECVEYARTQLNDFPALHLENLGISTFTGKERFFSPLNSSHDSWSSTNSQETLAIDSKEFEVISLPHLFLKYREVIKDSVLILKMDIEGAEKNIIPSICTLDFTLDFLAIEMDFLSLIPFIQFRRRLSSIFLARTLLRLLNDRGYKLIRTENFNFFWIKE